MKFSIYITLSLIILTICDDCSSKSESDCKGDCKWTAGTAASCALATCTVEGSTCKEGTTDCNFLQQMMVQVLLRNVLQLQHLVLLLVEILLVIP